MSSIATRAPARMRPSVIAWPMPMGLPAPVTIATFPCSTLSAIVLPPEGCPVRDHRHCMLPIAPSVLLYHVFPYHSPSSWVCPALDMMPCPLSRGERELCALLLITEEVP